ncbi:MAG: hypothetical protein CL842_01140 [Crocinitomicaceae bacterium]|nr:hypothetical protein [Crocinitomicaceae bacterium]|tara:strand:+ start:99767 stop:100222 length:456 start_codon:yes stop_codon:yes gene_type:complete
MEKLQLKKDILEAGKAKMEGVVNDFQERVNELKAAAGNDMQEIASQSESRTGSDIEFMDSLATQLDFAINELETLNRVDINTKHNKVEFGSVVVTDKRNLFVSTGIEEFEVGDKKYFGLSAQAPLYKNMAGCSQGDKVSFNGIEYKVLEVF